MNRKKQPMPYIRVAILSFLLIAVFPASSWSASQVSGHYTSSSGKHISLTITVSSPPPQSLIVTQKLPTGTSIITASPPYKKLKKKKNEAKWLFNGVKAGKISISMQLDKPVKRGEVQATLRFRDKQTGKMTALSVDSQ